MTGHRIDREQGLPRARIAAILLASASLGSAAFATSCSTVPPREWPPFDQRTVRATYRVDGGAIELPVSSPDLTVLELTTEPAIEAEHWIEGRRRVVPPAGCTQLTVRCVYRAYAKDGHVPTPQQVFATAISVEDLAP